LHTACQAITTDTINVRSSDSEAADKLGKISKGTTIDVIEVREGEFLGRDKITGKYQFNFIEDEISRENKPIIGYLAYFEYLNGFYKSIYWTKEKMQKHAIEYSQAYASDLKKKTSYSFWSKDFNGMAFKTMLRQLISKWGVMSIEIQEALTKDMSVINTDGSYNYVDSIPQQGVIEGIVETTPLQENTPPAKQETAPKVTKVNLDELPDSK